MKKNYCFVLSLFLFGTILSSCEKSGNYQEFDRNEIYKHLSSVNVRDAKMIYTKEGTNTRSGESGAFGGVWKIDQNGNESKLIITGSDGKTNVLNIYEINKLSDKILLMYPDFLIQIESARNGKKRIMMTRQILRRVLDLMENLYYMVRQQNTQCS
ncbi:hypothetical protein ACIXNL_01505 [Bacteroides fragilis]|nr:hypothetical protein [Bacteroides fragilis]